MDKNPLANLKDIQLAEPFGPWPLAYGWWLLALLIVFLLGLSCWWLWRHRRATRARKEALALLANISSDCPHWPEQVNGLLKRAVLTYYPHGHSANLYGENWVGFLSQLLPPNKQGAFKQSWQALQVALYQNAPARLDFGQIIRQAEYWLKTATPPSKSQRRQAYV